VLVLAIGALAIVGVRAAGDVVLAKSHLERSAAGASQAAAAELAELYVEWQQARDGDDPRGQRPLAQVMADPATIERARAAADRVALANRAERISDIQIACEPRGVVVTVHLGAQGAQADFRATECSPR
jgi:hypothetical protein